jgi:menaquinol-cytochrome c reductase cytochrome b/c subunit
MSTTRRERTGPTTDGRARVTPLEERREQFQRYKRDVKERGKPFYPYAMFHDTVMSLVVVSVIVGLAVIWKFTVPEEAPNETGLLGPLYKDEADPGTTNFVPRPDWYFYFLFYLLRIFKWPESVILGTVGIPTILLILLISMPFIDVRRERRLTRRPVAVVTAILVVIAMGVLTYKGATAKEALASELEGVAPTWAQKQGFAGNQQAVKGAELFAEAGCLTCHTYLGTGSSNLGAPDLSAEGAKGKGIEFQIKHLECPSCENPGSPMPPFADLPAENLRQLATFLEASKGGGGREEEGTPGVEIGALVGLGAAVLLILSLVGWRRGSPRPA